MVMPLLISVPHAGSQVPETFRSNCLLSDDDIRSDGDEGAEAIYSEIKDHVRCFETTDIARAVVDLNRKSDDFSKDGVIKTHTCWDVPIWSEPISDLQKTMLLERHYFPYHEKLKNHAKDTSLILGIDCHTMVAEGPPIGPDPQSLRPHINLGNLDHQSCPEHWAQFMYGCFVEEFGTKVTLNHPFKGGWITQYHHQLLPWIQLEISRAPFLPDREKGRKVLAALQRWVKKVDSG
ncbi:MAG: hypothetical protein D3926_15840 [Desulfobacteraceae bacterium]|nr:MAG: hypothetical protein D3926_15840 [Desulfobacteraceae bacterium]